MRIHTRGAGPHPDLTIAGNTLTLADITIDCAERQDDATVIIDLRRKGAGPVTEGGNSRQIASVNIPPKAYKMVDSGEKDDEGEPIETREAVPLDPDDVRVTLWTIPDQGA